jgi:type IV pilus assembly protein PilN
MIRINLLAVERTRAKHKGSFLAGQKITILCVSILILAVVFVGWRYLSLVKDSKQIDADLAAAQQETTRLHSLILQVQQFEQRKAQLQQRVQLIEQLRKGQTEPVHMLDQVSRALPPMLWLTELKQTGNDVVIDGRCMVLTSLSDFVSNLEASGYFKRSIEIVNSQAEGPSPAGNLIKFSIKARFQPKG